jgi:CcmD family protein
MLNSFWFSLVLLQAGQGILFQSDKIFTVLTVVLIIFSGLILYLWNLDRRISRMEKKDKDSTTA